MHADRWSRGLALVLGMAACGGDSGETGAGPESSSSTSAADTTTTSGGETTTTTESSSSAAEDSSSSTGEPEIPCPDIPECPMCIACAGSTGDCAELNMACQDESDCVMLVACLSRCADELCVDNCNTMFEAGRATYEALQMCTICDVCPTQCDDYVPLWCA